VFFHQEHEHVALAPGVVDDGGAGGAGLACSGHDLVGLVVFDEGDDQFEVHVIAPVG